MNFYHLSCGGVRQPNNAEVEYCSLSAAVEAALAIDHSFVKELLDQGQSVLRIGYEKL